MPSLPAALDPQSDASGDSRVLGASLSELWVVLLAHVNIDPRIATTNKAPAVRATPHRATHDALY